MRESMEGVKAPVRRGPLDFDPGSIFHVPFNFGYIQYFTAFIMQFQFYEAMCNASGHVGKLHECDFYQSEPAGRLLK